MASLLTHALVGTALGQAASPELRKRSKFWFVAILCSILPDFDVIGFRFGVRYGDLWGHRGMSHSLLFAALTAGSFAVWMQKGVKKRLKLASLLFAITASHGLLDALTDGGLGVAFFSPFDPHRYFFPWRPIRVSPIGARALFSSRVLEVLWSELWFWGVALVLMLTVVGLRAYRDRRLVAEVPPQNRLN
jgi:inner membrane protein